MDYALEKLEVYELAELFSDEIWEIVMNWDSFKKDTIGKQIVSSSDSISANIAEGYGIFFIRKVNSFIFIQEALFRKQNPGWGSVKGEKLLKRTNVMNCWARLR